MLPDATLPGHQPRSYGSAAAVAACAELMILRKVETARAQTGINGRKTYLPVKSVKRSVTPLVELSKPGCVTLCTLLSKPSKVVPPSCCRAVEVR